MTRAALIYIGATLAANVTAAVFLPLPFGLSVALGTFFFGLVPTQRDRLHRAGRRTVYTVIALAAVANLPLVLVLDTPARIIGASFVTILLAEAADTEVFAALKGHPWIVRVAGSNAVSVPLDSVLFTLLAFAGELPTGMLIGLIVGETLWKYGVSIIAALPGMRKQEAAV